MFKNYCVFYVANISISSKTSRFVFNSYPKSKLYFHHKYILCSFKEIGVKIYNSFNLQRVLYIIVLLWLPWTQIRINTCICRCFWNWQYIDYSFTCLKLNFIGVCLDHVDRNTFHYIGGKHVFMHHNLFSYSFEQDG